MAFFSEPAGSRLLDGLMAIISRRQVRPQIVSSLIIPLLFALTFCASSLFIVVKAAESTAQTQFHAVDHTLYFDSSNDASSTSGSSSMASGAPFLKPLLSIASLLVAFIISFIFSF
ncbi:hypothetical protein GOP47_0001737 [Adiantum capillus-veneris]|uniref:Uncharacterized protein n=1 Tax=Adiantum capillus-veneris TaxID=13818 RepID=A0A9D4V9I4_ADICA|nr:hypothetical protein GOP47_0001737 [Adiantum capillus-veneris]